jgi:hypothetical protein
LHKKGLMQQLFPSVEEVNRWNSYDYSHLLHNQRI